MTSGGTRPRPGTLGAVPPGPVGGAAARGAWAALGVLLLAVLAGAVTFDPRRWPSTVGDEATYLMAAQSLAWDGDLRYELSDLERFRVRRGVDPDGLILQSADGGATLLYAKPIWYPLYLAPFVRLLGVSGPAVANALLLIGAALVGAWAARAAAGGAAPLWSAVFLFASVAFVHVFWVHADLFQMTLVALALAVAVMTRANAAGSWRRFVVVGLLLGMATALRPVYAAIALAVALTSGGWRRCAAVLGGVTALAALTVSIDYGARGAWTSYGAERQGFYGYTGFPGEPGAASWARGVEGGLSASWVDGDVMPSQLDPPLQIRNLVYLALGRHVGLAPYFLPLLLGLAAMRRGRFAVLLLLGALASVVALSLLRPYNFWGGGGALANRYFLPVYPVFWFLACVPHARTHGSEDPRGSSERSLPAVLAWTLPLVIAALAAPALMPSWRAPRQFLRAPDGGYSYVSPLVQRLLPYETSQKHLKPAGREDFVLAAGAGGGAPLWVKPLSPRVRPLGGDGAAGTPAGALEVVPGASPAQVLLGSPAPIGAIELEGEVTYEAASPARWRLRLALAPTAVHSMWWTPERYYLYRLDLEEIASRAGAEPMNASSVTMRVLRVDSPSP